ncbi:MAG TPA: Gfo/Idh/MocA family oxidoreductase [Tepidisphaeraceae bacterium]|nr:Gfo/Idh/MocA family oxidoreductase [Tepidisphaeraceae bacterium]
MAPTLRFGILGTGNIARQFAAGFSSARRSIVNAVGSRSAGSARDFAAAHPIPTAVGSYEELLASRDIDAVYVSLPNSMHHEWTIKALRAGKHVLCEKPFAANTGQALEMFKVAATEGRVLTEAFMYRSHPLTHAVQQAVAGGMIGEPRLIRTSFCFRVSRTSGNIRFDPALAGGALMDVGCYCVNFSRMIAGAEPAAAYGMGQLHAGGVDEIAAGVLQFPGDLTASFTCGMNVQADNSAFICGTEGYIQVPVPWKPPEQKARWVLAHSAPPRMDQTGGALASPQPRQEFEVNAGQSLYALEADDFARAVLDGTPPVVSREDTLGNMRVLDRLRRQIGYEASLANRLGSAF